jgi:flagellar hook-length control protein FliK
MPLTALNSSLNKPAPDLLAVLAPFAADRASDSVPNGVPEQFSQVLAKMSRQGGPGGELLPQRQGFSFLDLASEAVVAENIPGQVVFTENSRGRAVLMENIGGKAAFMGLNRARANSPLAGQLLDFFKQIKKDNRSLGQMAANPDDLARLEEVLQNSGYTQEQAQFLLGQSLDSEGKVLDLDLLSQLVVEYPPQEGTAFLLNATDRPLLVQVLQDVGLSPSEIDNYLGQASRHGDQLLLRGLGPLLARAEENFFSRENLVDTSRLTSLLEKLGLEKSEIQTLLRQSQGQEQTSGVNAKTAFLLLETAAQKQNQQITQVLREMIARGAPPKQPETSPGGILRAQMIKSQQYMEKQVEETSPPVEQRPANNTTSPNSAAGAENSRSESSAPGEIPAARSEARGASAGNSAEPGAERQPKEQGSAKQTPSENKAPQGAGGGENVGKGNLAAPVAAARSNTSLLPAYVVRQVAFSMGKMVARGLDHLSLSLKPPSLGEISMELAVKDGAVKASLVAETVAAKKALEAGLENLKQHLAGQGIKVQQIEISVQPDAQRRQERAQDGERQQRRPRQERESAGTDEDAPLFKGSGLSVRA